MVDKDNINSFFRSLQEKGGIFNYTRYIGGVGRQLDFKAQFISLEDYADGWYQLKFISTTDGIHCELPFPLNSVKIFNSSLHIGDSGETDVIEFI